MTERTLLCRATQAAPHTHDAIGTGGGHPCAGVVEGHFPDDALVRRDALCEPQPCELSENFAMGDHTHDILHLSIVGLYLAEMPPIYSGS